MNKYSLFCDSQLIINCRIYLTSEFLFYFHKMIKKLLFALLLPLLNFSQELSADQFLEAFNDLDQFKKELFINFPLDPEAPQEQIILEKFNYTIYKTLSEEAPYILIADEAISIAMYGKMYKAYYDAFYKYLNEYCNGVIKSNKNIGLYDQWVCDNCSLMIKTMSGSKSGVFWITKNQ